MDISRLRAMLQAAGLSMYADQICGLAKNSINIKIKKIAENKIAIGQSKIGGLPDLAREIEWPVWHPVQAEKPIPLAFVAQFNLGSIAAFDMDNLLPRSGILYFFFDPRTEPWGIDPEDREGWRVFFWNGDSAQLSRTPAPKDLDSDYVYNACMPRFQSELTLPSSESLSVLGISMTERELGNYDKVLGSAPGRYEENANRLVGHPDELQGEMREQCQLAANEISCGTPDAWDHPRAPELLKGAGEWELLFQMSSDEKADMMWGDAGRLYYWIRKEDLVNRDFGQVWLLLQSY